MTEENLTPEQEAAAKLAKESESEEALEIDKIFSEIEKEDNEEEVDFLKRKVENIEKGVSKFFSNQGRKQKEEKQPEKKEEVPIKEATPQINPVLKTLYFDKFPETKEVWEEVEKEAKLLGKDPFELYESSSYFKGEAKSRFDAKAEEERNKEKIAKPSGIPGSSKTDISKIKPEEVDKLSPSQKSEWVKAQAKKEKEMDV